MPEIKTTWGLDWRDFKRGADDAHAYGASHAKEMNHEWRENRKVVKELGHEFLGFAGTVGSLGAMYELAKKSVEAFAEENTQAKRTMDKWAENGASTMRTIGADIFSAFSPVVDWLSEAGGKVWRAWQIAATHAMTGSLAEAKKIDAAQQEMLDKQHEAHEFRKSALAHEGAVRSAEVGAASGPFAGLDARMKGEFYRNRDRKAEIDAEPDEAQRKADLEWESRLHEANSKALNKELEEMDRQMLLANQTLDIDLRRTDVAELRAKHMDEEAARLDVQLNKEQALNDLQANRNKYTEEDFSRRWTSTSTKYNNMEETAGQAAAKQHKLDHDAAQAAVSDQLEQASIERDRVDGHQTRADLAEVALEYETKIRDVMKDEKLTMDEQVQAADSLARARDSILRASADEHVEKATADYRSAVAGRSFRSLASGSGPEAARGVFGPGLGAITLASSGSANTEVVKKLDLMNKALEAANTTLKQIAQSKSSASVLVQ